MPTEGLRLEKMLQRGRLVPLKHLITPTANGTHEEVLMRTQRGLTASTVTRAADTAVSEMNLQVVTQTKYFYKP